MRQTGVGRPGILVVRAFVNLFAIMITMKIFGIITLKKLFFGEVEVLYRIFLTGLVYLDWWAQLKLYFSSTAHFLVHAHCITFYLL